MTLPGEHNEIPLKSIALMLTNQKHLSVIFLYKIERKKWKKMIFLCVFEEELKYPAQNRHETLDRYISRELTCHALCCVCVYVNRVSNSTWTVTAL